MLSCGQRRKRWAPWQQCVGTMATVGWHRGNSVLVPSSPRRCSALRKLPAAAVMGSAVRREVCTFCVEVMGSAVRREVCTFYVEVMGSPVRREVCTFCVEVMGSPVRREVCTFCVEVMGSPVRREMCTFCVEAVQ